MSVFPERLNTSLVYTDTLTLTTPGSSSAFGTEFTYRLNSLFDPYFSLGGHQPYGYDQIMAFYNRYMVNSVDIELSFYDPSVDGLFAGAFLKNFYDSWTLQGKTIAEATEWPTSFVRPLSNTGSQVVTFRKHVDLAAMMGLTKSQYEGGWFALSGLSNTDPAQCPYLSIAVCDSRSQAASTLMCRVSLKYNSTFWGRKTVAAS